MEEERGSDTPASPESGMRLRATASLAPSLTSQDTFVGRRVAKAAVLLDALSAAVGSFLRRSPVARLLLLVYLIALHLWVLMVLSTVQREMHSQEEVAAWAKQK